MPAADYSELFGLQAVSTFPVRAQDGSRPQTWEIQAAPLSVISVSMKDPILSIFPHLRLYFILISVHCFLVYPSKNINS